MKTDYKEFCHIVPKTPKKKKNLKYIVCPLCIGVVAAITAACAHIAETPVPTAAAMDVNVKAATQLADPEAAIERIYSTLEEYSTVPLDKTAAEKIVGIEADNVVESHVYYSDPKSGLADIVIVKPVEAERISIREGLYIYKERKVQEFENYDILNAHAIAQNAIVYDQGDYVIMLMVEDTEAAKLIIDEYIPQ
ncbi:DUF4358 domain-containing protein [Ruminococcaceae bacterium OttesenSCG-928-L11]|nr:DUF4358 domain-containing protein [Ruminococcaceae bacterium OttesenSCG-928-L11]